MRRVLSLLTIALLLSPGFAKVKIELEFNRPGGWQADGRGFFLKCVNPLTGEVVGMDDELTEGESNSFYVDKDEHPQVVCWVFSFRQQGNLHRGPLVFRKKIETRYYYENGYAGNNVTLPSEAEIGVCGDGNVSGLETCDTSGDKGCAPPTPVCYSCHHCGCGKDSDCPQPSGTPPCGYGKCSETERPVDRKNSCIDGVCIFTYHCMYDPTCDPSTPPENESKGDVCLNDEQRVGSGTITPGEPQTISFANDSFEINVELDEGELDIDVNDLLYGTNVSPQTTGPLVLENDSLLPIILEVDFEDLYEGTNVSPETAKPLSFEVDPVLFLRLNEDVIDYYLIPRSTIDEEWNSLFFDVAGGADLEMIINLINSNLESVPPMVVSIFGNERMNIHLDEGNMFMETQDGLVVEMGNGLFADPTMNLYTDLATIAEIQAGTLNLIDALMDGRITYEAVGFVKGVQLFFVKILTGILSFFGVL